MTSSTVGPGMMSRASVAATKEIQVWKSGIMALLIWLNASQPRPPRCPQGGKCNGTIPSSDQVVDKIVFSALGIAGMQLHLAAHAGIGAGGARHGQHGLAGIEERPVHHDLSIAERKRPEALPRLSRHGADAP